MAVPSVFNFKKWIDEHRNQLKPPVGNAQVYLEAGNFIVMVVGGPNARKDYHYNESEEFFYQLEGNIVIKIVDEGKFVDINLNEGDIFLLPAKTPHSPRRGPNTIGLVMEKVRAKGTYVCTMYIRMYIFIYIHTYIHIYIYIYMESGKIGRAHV